MLPVGNPKAILLAFGTVATSFDLIQHFETGLASVTKPAQPSVVLQTTAHSLMLNTLNDEPTSFPPKSNNGYEAYGTNNNNIINNNNLPLSGNKQLQTPLKTFGAHQSACMHACLPIVV